MNDHLVKLKYRTWHIGIPPRRIKLDIPGWAGEPTYEAAMPWHCKPFMDASCYGLELFYPWYTELVVTGKNGVAEFHGDFGWEKSEEVPSTWEPVGAFAPGHFGMCSMVSIQTEPGIGMMVLPHPRVYTDRTGEVPLAVSGILEMDWWPDVFFLVFRTPEDGRRLLFQHGDPVASVIFVPKKVVYDLQPMTEEEITYQQSLEEKLDNEWMKYGTRTFHCKDESFFDNKYKKLSNIAAKHGVEHVHKAILDPTLLPYYGKERQIIDTRETEDKE